MTWDNFNMWLYGLASAFFAGVLWIVRKALTNEQKVLLLEQKLNGMEEDLAEMKKDIKLIILRNLKIDN